jgi:hypothetical protein
LSHSHAKKHQNLLRSNVITSLGLLGGLAFGAAWFSNYQKLSAPSIREWEWRDHPNVFIIGFKDRSGCGCLSNLGEFCLTANQLGAEVLVLTEDPGFFTKPKSVKCSIIGLNKIEDDSRFNKMREFSIWVKNGRIVKKSNTISDPSFLMNGIQK